MRNMKTKFVAVIFLTTSMMMLWGCGGGGGGSATPVEIRKNLDVVAAGSGSVSGGDYDVKLSAGAYNYSLADFAAGDKLFLPAGYTLTSVDNTGGYFDKKVILEVKSASNIIFIELTGLTDDQDKKLNFPSDLATVFGSTAITH